MIGSKGRALDQQLLNMLPELARCSQPCDSADMIPLGNKGVGIYCRQGIPWLESLFFSPINCQQTPYISNFVTITDCLHFLYAWPIGKLMNHTVESPLTCSYGALKSPDDGNTLTVPMI